jgi:Ca2+-transporting ATPase
VWEQRIHDATVHEARTIAMNVVVIVQTLYLLNCRSLTRSMFSLGVFSNRWVIFGISAMIAAQLLITYMPVLNRLFHTAPLPWDVWVRIVAVGVVAYAVVGLEKWIRFRVSRRPCSH